MTDSFDLVRDLPLALAGRSAAWDYIRGFAATWSTPLSPDDGTPETELTAAEGSLGIRLPAAVREAYMLFGRREDLHSNMQHLLDPGDFYVDDRKEALVFREENQGVASWGILLADLQHPDPPVRMQLDLADKDAERWTGWLPSFSMSCIEMVLFESPQADDPVCEYVECEAGDLDQHLTRLPFPAYPEGEQGLTFYTAPGILLTDCGGPLFIRAHDEQTLDHYLETLPLD